jgi:hypothetical protein
MMSTKTTAFLAWCCVGAADPCAAEVLWKASGSGGPAVTVASRSGAHWAAVFQDGAGQRLVLDAAEAGRAERFEQVTVGDDGSVAFWFRDGDREFVVAGGVTYGPLTGAHMPDLDAVAGMSRPSAAEWSYRGGTRTVFAGRDRNGDWVSLTRYPAAPAEQESRLLPMQRTFPGGPDPSTALREAIRFVLVRGRVPVFLTRAEDEECLWVGEKQAACAEQISMLAWAPESGRIAFAVRAHDGELTVHSGVKRHGPTTRLDWVTFSPGGEHLAFVMERDGQHALVLDDLEVVRFPRIEALAWLPGPKLAYLAHTEGRSILSIGGEAVWEQRAISAVYVGPDGKVAAWGADADGRRFLWPFAGLEQVTDLWNDGFLAGGRFFARGKLGTGRHVVVLGGELSPALDGISLFAPAPDGRSLAVVGAAGGVERVLLDGTEVPGVAGHVEEIRWSAAGPLLKVNRGGRGEPAGENARQKQECVVRPGVEEVCCAHLVASGWTAAAGLEALCLQPGKGFALLAASATRAQAPFDEVPPALLYRDDALGMAFAARRGEDWFRVAAGKVQGLERKPEFLLAAPDGPWFLVPTGPGRRWYAPGFVSREYSRILQPFFSEGRSLFLARVGSREAWVSGNRETATAGRALSAPVFVPGGFLSWMGTDEGVILVRETWSDLESRGGKVRTLPDVPVRGRLPNE